MTRKIIHSFKDKSQMQEILEKLYEYEGVMYKGGERPQNNNMYGISNDMYLCIEENILTNGSRFHDYGKAHWINDITISAYDYLNPIKIGDIVEVQDDSEYNGLRFEVGSEPDEHGEVKLLNDSYSIWRHTDYLKVLKDESNKIVEFGTSTGDLIAEINSVNSTTYATSSIGSDSISISDVETMIEEAVKLMSEKETEQILNTNKESMKIIEQEAKEIATEEYFDNKKVIKKIREADAEMQDLLKILENALKEIENKRSRLNGIVHNFNRNYSIRDMDSIKDMLSNHKEVIEFMDTFISQSVSDFIEETTKERFDVDKIFNR